MNDEHDRGLYPKYRVIKTDSPNYAHVEGDESIIKIQGWAMEEVTEPLMVMKFSDPNARYALAAYADAVEYEYPRLAADIRVQLHQAEENWREEIISSLRQQLTTRGGDG